jgi:predicted nuclease with TOPRIM domain
MDCNERIAELEAENEALRDDLRGEIEELREDNQRLTSMIGEVSLFRNIDERIAVLESIVDGLSQQIRALEMEVSDGKF